MMSIWSSPRGYTRGYRRRLPETAKSSNYPNVCPWVTIGYHRDTMGDHGIPLDTYVRPLDTTGDHG